jgi:cytochrome c-type biogenesis protein CcmH
MRKYLTSILQLLSIAFALQAGQTCAATISDASIEQRVQRIAEELHCVVCQNQTIADSHAGLAILLRQQVRDMLVQGISDQQTIDFMMQRYGDFVLYRTPHNNPSGMLWLGPLLLLLFALVSFRSNRV